MARLLVDATLTALGRAAQETDADEPTGADAVGEAPRHSRCVSRGQPGTSEGL
jgi:hypothetical protein